MEVTFIYNIIKVLCIQHYISTSVLFLIKQIYILFKKKKKNFKKILRKAESS